MTQMLLKKGQSDPGREKEVAEAEKGKSSVDRRVLEEEDMLLEGVHTGHTSRCGGRPKNMLVFCPPAGFCSCLHDRDRSGDGVHSNLGYDVHTSIWPLACRRVQHRCS